MASEFPIEERQWSDNIKVYTRKKFKPKNKNIINNNNFQTSLDNDINNNNNNNNNSLIEKHVVVNGVVSNNNKTTSSSTSSYKDGCDNEGKNDEELGTEIIDVQEKGPPFSPPLKVVVEEANSSQPQPISPLPLQNSSRLGTASGDSASFVPLLNGNLANGLDSRPFVVQVDDRVNISGLTSRSKEEVQDLKRKLEDELIQVRKMSKRLKEKEVMIGWHSSFDVETTNAPSSLHFLGNGGIGVGVDGVGMRMESELSSTPFHASRPFRKLSVSVVNNNNHQHGGVVGDVIEKEKRTPKANQYYRNSDFLLGKEKLPPESNRKTKSAGSKKQRSGDFDHRLRFDKKIFGKCSNLLKKLMNHKHGWVFNTPVDVKRLGLHDYFDIIKYPMDLGTVKARLSKNEYKTPREFAEDVRLTFHNAMTYNPVGQDVHVMAQELLRIFEEKWSSIEREYDYILRYEMICDMGVPTPTSRKTYTPSHISTPMSLVPPPLHSPPPFQEGRKLERSQSMFVRPQSRTKTGYPGGRKPVPKKPKAKDAFKRDMTYEEKQKLSTNLQSLPSDRLDAIVQIIKKGNSALSEHDDEIEVDIDSVDNETLWELDRLVTNYKKNLSKRKRKAEIAQARAAALTKAAQQQTIPAPSNVEVTRETIEATPTVPPDQTKAGKSPRVQQETRSGNKSGSSSSSSSSSDSGSSSSDSDSDSSSGSESDGGQ